MEWLGKWWRLFAVLGLLAVQAAMFTVVVHRESLTFDENDHMYAGYRMWTAGDYGLNPEHPPLVKLLATIPLLGEKLWTPPLEDRFFKNEAYLDGREWLTHDDGAGQRLVFRMRLAAGLLALALTMVVFWAAWEWFGSRAAMVALILVVFEPNIIGHSALVTTDVGVSLFFLLAVFLFWRYVQRPTVLRLIAAGVGCGLLLATKHSGILIAPMLIALAGWETWQAEKGARVKRLLGMLGALASMAVIAVVVLWAFYGFRYAARPAGLALNPTLDAYMADRSGFDRAVVGFFAKMHLLPESYLMGLVDVKKMAEFYPTFILGHNFAHGVWWYFPVVLLIKTTIGLMVLGLLGAWIFLLRREFFVRDLKVKDCPTCPPKKPSEANEHIRHALVYLIVPGLVYLAVAMASGMNIGSRHVLPLYALMAIFAGAAVARASVWGRGWVMATAVLVALHAGSGMMSFPVPMAYANEAWGGPKNLHTLLSDANVDWAQQLLSVKKWQDAHPGEECWFAYFAQSVILPSEYGVKCHVLSGSNSYYTRLEKLEPVPPVVNGTVLISAGELSGCEWPTGQLNAFRDFEARKPDEEIDYGVMVYRGRFEMRDAAALSRVERAQVLLDEKKAAEALAETDEALKVAPGYMLALETRGDAAAVLGNKSLAAEAWKAAIVSAQALEPDARVIYVGELEQRLKGLGN